MSRRVPEGPAPDPAVQRLRVQYAKRGRMRFTSTRDFQRALERAVRRAGVPMAYSAGFHPHPKISYANAAPTGTASEAEYVELSVTERVDAERVRTALDEALPEGLDVIRVAEAVAGSLADRLEASTWVMVFPGVPPTELDRAVAGFLDRREVLVTRLMKRGPRDVDARGPVLDATCRPGEGGAELEVTLRHTTPTIRPEEIWKALTDVLGRQLPRPRSTRLAQGPMSDGRPGDPLAS